MRRKQLEMSWTVGFAASLEAAPEKRVPATVPGAVQLDWARAHGWPGHTFADNYRQYGWMADVYWSYQADTALPQPGEDERLFFVCQGVDYQFQVRLAGEVLLEQEGMFTPVELDLTDKVRPGAKLEVLVFPAPKAHDAPADRTQARLSCKPAAAYTWDWHPRLIPLGIWDETCLELRPAVHLADAETSYELADDLGSAAVRADVRLSEPGRGTIRWRLLDPDGERVLEETADADAERRTLEQTVARPRLWWPHTEGEQPLYRSVVELLSEGGEVLDRRESRVGFRQVRLVMAPGQWEEPAGFPKGRSNPPITLEINGRAIFARGSNWVPPSVFPGTIDAATYRPLLELVRGAHMNILRSWGGGIVNKAAFFELCDEMGLLVWQEFPLACNDYPDDPAYLRVLDRESRSIIRRLRRHACLAIWCGGNELFNSWSGMTDQSLALRLLNRNCYDLDPGTPFLPTSPVMGMAHGHYQFRDRDGTEVFQLMPAARNTAYTEFGCPGPSPADYLRTFIPEDELFPPRPGSAWEHHHGFGAWLRDDWLGLPVLEHYFGESGDLDTLTERGQLLQAAGYRCIFEEARRQKPRCSMALNWCFNEPWPTAANNSIVNWPASPKPSYEAVAAACRVSLASARIPRFVWREGETFEAELWLLHDGPAPLPGGRLEASLEAAGERVKLVTWEFPDAPANTNLPGPIARWPLPAWEAERFELVLRVENRPELASCYTLLYRPAVRRKAAATRTLNL